MMYRSLSLCVLLVGALLFPWWAVVLCLIPYTLRYPGYELIMIMVLIDGYYGAFTHVPYLTLGTMVVVGSMSYVRPRVRTPEISV